MAKENQEGTTALQLALAWGFVGIPLTLGVLQTLDQRNEAFPVGSQRLENTAAALESRRPFYSSYLIS